MSKISIIIPLYNSEKYISETIDSIVNQSIFNLIKVIIVDDGSTDLSLRIANEYAIKYKNIEVYQKENGGVVSARNYGIKKVNTEYVGFVDSDDTINPMMYEKLLNLIEEDNYDISSVDFSFIYDRRIIKKRKRKKYKIKDNKKILKKFLSGNTIENTLSDKLFRTKHIKNIVIPENYSIGEDMYFLFKVLKRINSINIDNTESMYNYFIRSNTATNSKFSSKYFDAVILSEIIEAEVDYDLKERAEAHTLREISKCLGYMHMNKAHSDYYKIKEEYVKKIKNYSLIKIFRYLDFKQVIILLIIRIDINLYYKILNFYKRDKI